MRATHRFLSLGPALAVAVTLSTFLAPAASAATARLTFGEDWGGMEIGSECIRGRGAADTTIHLTWKSASGALKAKTDVAAVEGSGYWSYCSETKTLAKGDTVKVADSLGARTFTMPNVTFVADRVNDVFRGKGPINSAGAVWYMAGLFADYGYNAEFATDANGSWSVDADEDNLIGGIIAEVYFQTPKGDWTYAQTVTPYVSTTLGRARFTGGTGAFRTIKASIRDAATSVIKGRDTQVSGQTGHFSGVFKDADASPVAVAAGDRLVSNIASDANWIVPNITGTANVATDHVTGQCFDAGTS